MKIRLYGTLPDCAAVAATLRDALDVVNQSAPYPDRGDSQFYLDVRL